MIQDPIRIFASINNSIRCRCRGLAALSLALCFLLTGHEAPAVDWPEYRGPFGDGHVSAPGDNQPTGLPLHWSETENVKWKTPIPFRGWSTPVVMDGQVWLTTATIDGHDFYAIAVDAGTGKILFNQHLFHADNPEPLGNGASMNCYATPSPVIVPGLVYVHFGRFGTACLDTATGQSPFGSGAKTFNARPLSRPILVACLFENLLILTLDSADVQYCIALDKQTGQTVWKTDRSVVWNDADVPGQMAKDGDLRKAHSTPLIVNADGKMQMLSGGAKAAYVLTIRAPGRIFGRSNTLIGQSLRDRCLTRARHFS